MHETAPAESSLFVIGSSAGGVDALEYLVSVLPADFAAPIVIAQHLDPAHPSRLKEILEPLTPLKVHLLAGRAALERGTIYVVPSGQHAEIGGGHVFLSSKMKSSRPKPSINLLFQTAAEEFGERLVAVILSGTGTDGAAGVRTVKEAGGTVVVQDPATAAYPALPNAIPPSQIDLVTPLKTMGALLTSITAQNETPAVLADDEMLRAFLTQLRGRSGIDFTQYKMPTIVRRLSRLIAAARCTTLPDYMRYLTANPSAYQHLIGSFLIKVTGFFRDPELFTYLREQVLPDIIAQAKQERSEIRIWSAGCATGEEPYSIAILLAELLGDELEDVAVRIFATDLDPDSIVFARRGLYAAAALDGLPADLRDKHFVKVDDSYQVRKRIRNLTVFGEYDLGQRAPFPRIDLILCRNVLIYFTKELQQRTLQLFAFSLRPAGYLVLGKAETTSPLSEFFAAYDPALKVFRRQGDRLLIPAPSFAGTGAVRGAFTPRRGIRRASAAERAAEPGLRWSLTERLGSFLFDSPIGVIVVDRNYDIQTINQAARMMLAIHGPGIGDDIIHLTGGPSGALIKNALDAAFRNERATGSQPISIRDETTGETRHLQIGCYPDASPNADGSAGPAFVIIVDETPSATERLSLRTQTTGQQEEIERLTALTASLHERQRALMEANRELTVANNELRGTNEHLLIAAEEAEASAEEVETLNEEMQAGSEELETLNEELQATVEELNTTNEELRSRSIDLEKSSAELETWLQKSEEQRTLFQNALSNLPIPLAVTNAAGEIILVSAAYRALPPPAQTLSNPAVTTCHPEPPLRHPEPVEGPHARHPEPPLRHPEPVEGP